MDIRVHVRSAKPIKKKENSTKQKTKEKIKEKIVNLYKKVFHNAKNQNLSDWPDMIFSHYVDTDDLGIYFIHPCHVNICDDASDELLVSYDHNSKIVSIDLEGISELFQSHIFNSNGLLNVKLLDPVYYEDSDTLKINFVNPNSLPTKTLKTDIDDIEIEKDSDGKINSLLFYNTRNKIAKSILSKEDIEILEKNYEI